MKKILLGLILMLAAMPIFAQAAQPVISWTYAAADVTTYGVTTFSIERKTEACAGTLNAWSGVGAVASTLRTFTDLSVVVAGTTYCWRVAAVSALGQGPYSNTAEKTIIGLPPAPGAVTVI